ncbi:glycosyltransferase family 2 protein [Microbacterium sp. No. 7]|uniref:glycosyltransferase family 2 protein n=1 Tax=Microbacterium sp. No. 7 TaxID=1714373 RepID=UPI0009E7E3B9|nr:glycosyltransferase family 2 protein [Microbacterium sp. No. 7]
MSTVPLRPLTPTVTVVVPAFNEARNLELVLPALDLADEIIVVDGHSTDDTVQTVQRVAPHARLIQQTRAGKGNALACGFAAARCDVIVAFDADGSADPAEIAVLVGALTAGADFVKGSRVLVGGGSADLTRVRSLGNRGLTLAVNALFGTRYSDLCYGYNAFWRDILPSLGLPDVHGDEARWGDGFEIETLLNCRVAKLRVAEVPSYEHSRAHGASNLHAVRDGLRVLRTIFAERFGPSGAEPASRLEIGAWYGSDLEARRAA